MTGSGTWGPDEISLHSEVVPATGWYIRSDGTRVYVIDGEIVDRQTWLCYCGEHELGAEWTGEA